MGDVAIVDGELTTFHPTVGRVRETHTHRPDTQGMDIAIGILPTFLQEADTLSHISPFDGARLAEARLLNARITLRRFILIVELDSPRATGVWNTHVDLRHRVSRIRYRFQHGARVDAASGKHTDIDNANGFATDNMGGEFHTLPRTVAVGINADIRLDHSGHLGIDIAIGPRRATLIGECTCSVEGPLRPHLIERLGVATD